MTTADTQHRDSVFTPVLIAGGFILLISFAIRASFGIFQIPIAEDFNWPRADFSFAIAIQNLFWGIGQPIFSAIAEKFGDRKAIVLGVAFYMAGLIGSSYAVTAGQHQFLEMLVGFGIAGTGFGVILAIVGRATSDKHRSMALGIVTAAGSAGQIIGPPIAEALLQFMTWQNVFLIFAGGVAASMLVLPFVKAPAVSKGNDAADDLALSTVLKQAGRDRNYMFIFIGFFACGYQLAFITAHFPAFITEICGPVSPGSVIHSMGITTTSALGAASIAVIGIFNVMGTVLSGWLGNRYSRKYLLAVIYGLRTIVAAAFILTPMTPETVILFSIIMGGLWLATVPLTSGLVAQIYGLKYMGTLYGFVFFSHQLGGFLGVWLGGYMYDHYGSYDLVWWVGVGVGAVSALIHLPIDDRPWALSRAKAAA
ncbi:MFS transporter [Terasakiella sp. A23]|uniref:MFS transporter n=1 Tax=Terasakiella sp. FCG-A23 TaxID=3080561 RepID=UPI0029555033|nr:MFS transporter [Terasakiella sp. A23]MDV7340656.1 MFS transporter [Terasakiella sp. A23]